MKAVILAGGYGTRISEESSIRPKPMVEIGGKPILWHIMKIYAHHGITEFIICCGYKGHVIKEYFADYFLRNADVTFSLVDNEMRVHRANAEPWTVTLVHTGHNTMTGGRLRRVREYVGNETFCLTYGDGVSDIDVSAAVAHHREQGRLATLTAVHPPGRFGVFNLSEGSTSVQSFTEKPSGGEMPWINGGYFVLEPAIFDYIDSDDTVWEKGPLEQLAAQDQLTAFRHTGFWQPMDTLHDKNVLESLWQQGVAPWYVWTPEPAWTPTPEAPPAPDEAPARALPSRLLSTDLVTVA